MTLGEVVLSNKKFRRGKTSTTWFVANNDHILYADDHTRRFLPSLEDIKAKDWEIEERTVPMSLAQVQEIFDLGMRCSRGFLTRPSVKEYHELLTRLGFKE